MNLDNQSEYWDKVAAEKTFSHPINLGLLLKYVSASSKIVDYGCGYGRLVKELLNAGLINVTGYDTSLQLVDRGRKEHLPRLFI